MGGGSTEQTAQRGQRGRAAVRVDPVAPVVLGIVLGNMVEENFRRAVIMDGYGAFFRDKLAFIVLLLALLSFVYPLFKQWRERRAESK